MILSHIVIVLLSLGLAAGAGRVSMTDELRVDKLEILVEQLQQQVSELKKNQETVKCGGAWSLKRTEILFPELEKLKLESFYKTPVTFVEPMPTPLPNNTQAIIVQVFGHFRGSHHCHEHCHHTFSYINVEIQQEGNEESGTATLESFHSGGNTFTDEIQIPWDNTISEKLQVKFTCSWQDEEHSDNWYRIRVVGYILA